MRVLLLVLIVAVAGCASPGTTQTTSTAATGSTAPPTTATPNATEDAPLVGPRGPVVVESFVLAANRTLQFANASVGAPPAKVPEAFTGTQFFTSTDPSLFKPWPAAPARNPYEVVEDVTIVLRFTAEQPAATVTKAFMFPTVGGWIGSQDRYAVYFGAADAPDTLEGGKTYTVRMVAKMPPGGLFVRQGEVLVLYTYLGYQSADGGAMSYVVGGPDPAGLSIPHVHFNVSAPVATTVLEKAGTLGPNPTLVTANDPQPVDLPFDVPAGTAYVVAEVVGAPTTSGSYLDVDLDLRSPSGEALGRGSGPSGHEIVELGPTALAKAGGKLVAHVAGAGEGGTFRLVVTAYGRA